MAADQANPHALLSDEPIIETERVDELSFRPTAEVLARAALHTKSPITIGVFGNWGTGKTSLMRLMKEVIEGEGRAEDDKEDGTEEGRVTVDQIEKLAVPVWFNTTPIACDEWRLHLQ